jgi:hypothetical protein
MIIVCVCGKVCTSKPGLVLHQKKCDKAKQAISKGKPTTSECDVQEAHVYTKEVQELVNIMKDAAADASKALTTGNKSAGRRARNLLNDFKKKITPLRKLILKKINGI